MPDSTETSAAGTAARAQRATAAAAIAARDEAWRAYIKHTTGDCDHCRTTGIDCQHAAILKRTWRDSRDAA